MPRLNLLKTEHLNIAGQILVCELQGCAAVWMDGRSMPTFSTFIGGSLLVWRPSSGLGSSLSQWAVCMCTSPTAEVNMWSLLQQMDLDSAAPPSCPWGLVYILSTQQWVDAVPVIKYTIYCSYHNTDLTQCCYFTKHLLSLHLDQLSKVHTH